MEKLKLNHSRIAAFQHCRKRYAWCYIEHLKPKQKSAPLMIGDITHRLIHANNIGKFTPAMLENLDEYVAMLNPNNTADLSVDVAIEAARLVVGYLDHYKDDPLKFISSEVWAEYELEECTLFGKIDALARDDQGRLLRAEHKTAAKTDTAYLNGLKNGLQGSIYDFLAEKLLDEKVYATVYNLLVKTKVPQFLRVYKQPDPSMRDLMLQTVKGIAFSLKRCLSREEEFFPSCQCYSFGRECDYRVLCNYDTPDTRSSFFDFVEDDEYYYKEQPMPTTEVSNG